MMRWLSSGDGYEQGGAGVFSDPVRLSELLGALGGIEGSIEAEKTLLRYRMNAEAGYSEEAEGWFSGSSPLPRRREFEDLRNLEESRDSLYGTIAREALPAGRWVRHGRKVYCLADRGSESNVPDGTVRQGRYGLYEIFDKEGRWIPDDVEEDPEITLRRVHYARGRTQGARDAAGVLGIAFVGFFIGTEYVGPWIGMSPNAVLVVAIALVVSSLFVFRNAVSYLADTFINGTGGPPFLVVEPVTGEVSPRYKTHRESIRR